MPTSSWAMEREELGEVDISRSEGVEHELNRLIERRHDRRTAQERHKPSEELWQESVERYNAERDRQLRTEWGLSTTRARLRVTGPSWSP